MHLDREVTTPVADLIRHAQAQLSAVLRMLQDGRACEDVVSRLADVSTVLDRAGFALVTNGMDQCIATADGPETRKMQKLFLSLT